MNHHVLFTSGPDHLQAAQCNNNVTDVGDVMVKTTVLTEDGRHRYVGCDTADLGSAQMFGSAGVTGYSATAGRKPKGLSLTAASAGHIFFRSSWGEGSHFIYMRYGPLGSRREHADLTHISLHYRGCPILMDSGRYPYVEEEPLRSLLKSAQTHNVYVIGKEFHGGPGGSRRYGNFGQSLKNYYREQGPVHYGEMAYHGYLMLGVRCLVIYKVMAVDQGVQAIVSGIRCDDGHEVKGCCHLDSVIRGTPMETGTDGAGECWRLCSGGDDATTVLGPRLFETVPCVIPKRYNRKERSTCLVGKAGFTDRITDWACLFGEGAEAEETQVFQYGNNQSETEGQATAMSFCLSPDESWGLLIWNQEIR